MAESKESSRPPRRRFPRIAASAFQHPMDIKALEAVKMAKGVDLLMRKVNEYGFERYLYINNIADNVQVTPLQCPKIYEMLIEACEILDVEVPQIYIDQDPTVNAYTFGSEKPFIILHSGLIDLMNDDELFTIIVHEVGHIKCGHVLYKMVARFLRVVVEMIGDMTFGIGKLLTGPILMAFYEWDRKSELSADRAGLLGIQNVDIVTTTLMKLAGGSHKVVEQFDKDQFLRQADNYLELDSSTLNQIYKFLQVAFRTHPFPALRAREINTWANSTEYQNIMNGIYPTIDLQPYRGTDGYDFGGSYPRQPPPYSPPSPSGTSTTCANCHAKVEVNATFCHVCGSKIMGVVAIMDKTDIGGASTQTPSPPKPDNKPHCNNCGAVLKPTDDYCPSCGLNTRLNW
jgi:Zn-dependent protease with chaperone function/RNA polymerase subunit RPABC4/transcription elongation factor Spt4